MFNHRFSILLKHPGYNGPVVAAVAGSVVSSALSGGSNDDASKDNAKATAAANARLDRVSKEAETRYQPEINYGNLADSSLANYLGLGSANNPGSAAFTPLTFDQWNAQYGRKGTGTAALDPRYVQDFSLLSHVPAGGNINQFNQNAYQDYLRANPAKAAVQPTTADGTFGSLLKNFDNSDFVKDPGYEFRLDEGLKGIDRATAARGGYDSGATLKALAKYNQDYASNEFSSAYNRDSTNKSRIYDFLSGVTNRGTGAKNAVTSAATGTAINAGNNLIAGANQQGAYQVAGAAGVNNAIQSGIGNYLYGQQMNQPVTSSPIGGTSYATGQQSWYA